LGTKTPEEAKRKLINRSKEFGRNTFNLEEQAISLVGKDIYEILIKEYTEKQWGKKARTSKLYY
jgi:UDP-galactopyranose mutase